MSASFIPQRVLHLVSQYIFKLYLLKDSFYFFLYLNCKESLPYLTLSII